MRVVAASCNDCVLREGVAAPNVYPRRIASSRHVLAEFRRSWVLRELDTQHNAYIDQLVAHVQQLISSLKELGVPEHVKRVLMHEAVTMICEQLVDGYCYTKKCSDEVRADPRLS